MHALKASTSSAEYSHDINDNGDTTYVIVIIIIILLYRNSHTHNHKRRELVSIHVYPFEEIMLTLYM